MHNEIQPKAQIDLDRLIERTKYEIRLASEENAQERESRLKREEADAQHERKKDFLRFVIASSIVAITAFSLLAFTAYALFNKNLDPEIKKLAVTVVVPTVILWIGFYLHGRNAKDK